MERGRVSQGGGRVKDVPERDAVGLSVCGDLRSRLRGVTPLASLATPFGVPQGVLPDFAFLNGASSLRLTTRCVVWRSRPSERLMRRNGQSVVRSSKTAAQLRQTECQLRRSALLPRAFTRRRPPALRVPSGEYCSPGARESPRGSAFSKQNTKEDVASGPVAVTTLADDSFGQGIRRTDARNHLIRDIRRQEVCKCGFIKNFGQRPGRGRETAPRARDDRGRRPRPGGVGTAPPSALS